MNDSKIAEVREMLLTVARSLVDHPEKLTISVIPQETGTLFQIRSSATDVGKLIGNSGRTARAIRLILAANSMKLKHTLRLDIAQPESM